MPTGRGNQLTKQVGEYLAAAELGRLGLIAAPFAGNVPDYDIIATDRRGRSVPVQVKAVTRGSWQFRITDFAEVEQDGKRQILGSPKAGNIDDLVCVMVSLQSYGEDRFYVLSWEALRDVIITHHEKYLAKHGGVRPRNPESVHVSIKETDLKAFQDKWLVEFRDRHDLLVT